MPRKHFKLMQRMADKNLVKDSTSIAPFSVEESTSIEPGSVEKSTSIGLTSVEEYISIRPISVEESSSFGPISVEESTSILPFSLEESTSLKPISVERHTSIEPNSIGPISVEEIDLKMVDMLNPPATTTISVNDYATNDETAGNLATTETVDFMNTAQKGRHYLRAITINFHFFGQVEFSAEI